MSISTVLDLLLASRTQMYMTVVSGSLRPIHTHSLSSDYYNAIRNHCHRLTRVDLKIGLNEKPPLIVFLDQRLVDYA